MDDEELAIVVDQEKYRSHNGLLIKTWSLCDTCWWHTKTLLFFMTITSFECPKTGIYSNIAKNLNRLTGGSSPDV